VARSERLGPSRLQVTTKRPAAVARGGAFDIRASDALYWPQTVHEAFDERAMD